MAESFWNYLMRITSGASGVAISRAAEVDAGNVSRWKTGKTRPSAESVVKIARVWRRPPVEALVASGHLAPKEVTGVIEVARPLADLDDEELIAEVLRRMQSRTPAAVEVRAPAREVSVGPPNSGDTFTFDPPTDEQHFDEKELLAANTEPPGQLEENDYPVDVPNDDDEGR